MTRHLCLLTIQRTLDMVVGLFFKTSLPVIVRNDLSFDESIVIELKFGRKKIFFTVLYRSPAFKHTSFKFQAFLSNFKNLHSEIQGDNPFTTFFTGDFNGGLMVIQTLRVWKSQIISEPTNFGPNFEPLVY